MIAPRVREYNGRKRGTARRHGRWTHRMLVSHHREKTTSRRKSKQERSGGVRECTQARLREKVRWLLDYLPRKKRRQPFVGDEASACGRRNHNRRRNRVKPRSQWTKRKQKIFVHQQRLCAVAAPRESSRNRGRAGELKVTYSHESASSKRLVEEILALRRGRI